LRENTARGRGRGGQQYVSNNSRPRGACKRYQQGCQYLGSAKHASDYAATTSYLINQIKKAYSYRHDIATTLDQLQHINFSPFKPTLESSQGKDEDTMHESHVWQKFHAQFASFTEDAEFKLLDNQSTKKFFVTLS
jgi:hypothetical protein